MTNINTGDDKSKKEYRIKGYYNRNEGEVITGSVNIDEDSVYAQISTRDLQGALHEYLKSFWGEDMQQHFSKMLQSVDTETPTFEEVDYVHDRNLSPYQKDKKDELGGMQHRRMEALYKNYAKYEKRYPYRKLVATQGEETSYGRWQEVFFSHMMKRHAKAVEDLIENNKNDFSFLSFGNINLTKRSVLAEERNA